MTRTTTLPPNGNVTIWKFVSTSLVGALLGVLTMWLTLGGDVVTHAELKSHTADKTIHERDDAKRARIREEVKLAIEPLRRDIQALRDDVKEVKQGIADFRLPVAD